MMRDDEKMQPGHTYTGQFSVSWNGRFIGNTLSQFQVWRNADDSCNQVNLDYADYGKVFEADKFGEGLLELDIPYLNVKVANATLISDIRSYKNDGARQGPVIFGGNGSKIEVNEKRKHIGSVEALRLYLDANRTKAGMPPINDETFKAFQNMGGEDRDKLGRVKRRTEPARWNVKQIADAVYGECPSGILKPKDLVAILYKLLNPITDRVELYEPGHPGEVTR